VNEFDKCLAVGSTRTVDAALAIGDMCTRSGGLNRGTDSKAHPQTVSVALVSTAGGVYKGLQGRRVATRTPLGSTP
jgi:hypothetical protein